MIHIHGTSILPGLAVGRSNFYRREEQTFSRRGIGAGAERARLERAYAQTGERLGRLRRKALEAAGEEEAAILEIHQMLLEDEDFRDGVEELLQQGFPAEYAARQAAERIARTFEEMDGYMRARAADIRDVAAGLVDVLRGTGGLELTVPSIVVAEDLAPSETVRLDRALLLGFITRAGSPNGHAAILARGMGLPGLVQCGEISEAWDGKLAVIDGYNACAYVDPDPDLLERLKERREEELCRQALLRELKDKPSATLDGRTIQICANIGSPGDVDAVLDSGAEGVGLFRSEFLYLNGTAAPTEEEQLAAYRRVLEALAPRKVVIRTCDLGADKQADYLELDREENPALGCRGVRLCLTRKELFKTQLRALLRASLFGNLAVMFPMIVSRWELRACKELLSECRAELERAGVPAGEPEVGIMVETPAAALCADELAEECDFFSIGTNDLTQYICALDRQNAKLEPFFDPRHPAVLRAVQMAVEAGRRHGCRVGICGELGADPDLTETFLRMGVDELSVPPGRVLPLRRVIRELDLSK